MLTRRVGVRVPAPDGHRFASGAFDRLLGSPVRDVVVSMCWDPSCGAATTLCDLDHGVLVNAAVAEDGMSAWIEVEATP